MSTPEKEAGLWIPLEILNEYVITRRDGDPKPKQQVADRGESWLRWLMKNGGLCALSFPLDQIKAAQDLYQEDQQYWKAVACLDSNDLEYFLQGDWPQAILAKMRKNGILPGGEA